MRRRRASRLLLRRATGAAMLALAPLLLLGGPETHLAHPAGRADTPVFSDAQHASEARHWEAAGTAHLAPCSDCLAPTQSPGTPPAGPAARRRPAAGQAALAARSHPLDSGADRSRAPRGPPPSGSS